MPNAVLKVDKPLVVYPQKVPTVKVYVSFYKHIVEFLLLCLLLVVGVAGERHLGPDLAHQ